MNSVTPGVMVTERSACVCIVAIMRPEKSKLITINEDSTRVLRNESVLYSRLFRGNSEPFSGQKMYKLVVLLD